MAEIDGALKEIWSRVDELKKKESKDYSFEIKEPGAYLLTLKVLDKFPGPSRSISGECKILSSNQKVIKEVDGIRVWSTLIEKEVKDKEKHVRATKWSTSFNISNLDIPAKFVLHMKSNAMLGIPIKHEMILEKAQTKEKITRTSFATFTPTTNTKNAPPPKELRQSSLNPTDLLANLVTESENGNATAILDLEHEIERFELRLASLQKQKSGLEALLLLYESKSDQSSSGPVKEQIQEINFEITRLAQLKDRAHSILAKNGLKIEPQVTINWNYDSKDDTQISLKGGQTAKLLDASDPDWWFVEYEGKQGFFPSSYCNPIIYRAEVLFDWTASTSSELTVAAGTEIEAFPVNDTNDWLNAKDKNGNIGFVPAKYVEILGTVDDDQDFGTNSSSVYLLEKH